MAMPKREMLDMGYEIFDVTEMSMHPGHCICSHAGPSISEADHLVYLGSPAELLSPLCGERPSDASAPLAHLGRRLGNPVGEDSSPTIFLRGY
jgi:hypothetical protein